MTSAIRAANFALTLVATVLVTPATAHAATEPAVPDLTPAGGGTAAAIAAVVVLGLVVLATLARAARNYAHGRKQTSHRPQS